MRELEEISYKELSDAAGLPSGPVISQLIRGRKRLLGSITSQLKEART